MSIKVKYHHCRTITPHARKGPPPKGELYGYSQKLKWLNPLINVAMKTLFDDGPSSKGGCTCCLLVDDYLEVVGHGCSTCSFSDNFSYAKGRKLSLARAFDDALEHGVPQDVLEAEGIVRPTDEELEALHLV